MDEKLAILKAKKTGLFIRQARESNMQTVDNCAFWLNLNREDYEAVEKGESALSIPQLESLSFFLGTPFAFLLNGPFHLNENETAFDRNANTRLLDLRDHVISAMLKQKREERNITLEQLTGLTKIPLDILESYEGGSIPIPFLDLEEIIEKLDLSLDTFFSEGGPFGHHQNQETQAPSVSADQLPANISDFVSKPVNRPYLELAIHLSQMEANKLRAIASSLLEITY